MKAVWNAGAMADSTLRDAAFVIRETTVARGFDTDARRTAYQDLYISL